MSKLPSSQTARAGVVGSTAIKLGLGQLKSKAKRPFLSVKAQQEDKNERDDAQAELLFKAITQLRGTAVKLAQMLGMETGILPKRITDELAKSYHQIPPLNRVLIAKVMLAEFGESPDKLFKQFDHNALAAASLGQVHRAVLDDGTAVAVKIQYPGINVTIDSDMNLLSKLSVAGMKLTTGQKPFNAHVIEQSIQEVGARLREEIDYRLEARNTRWFKDHLIMDGVELPEVYEPFCTDKVITTQLLDGVHLDEWLADNPSQEARNRAAQTLYDLFVFSTLQLRRLHADPNPGNYLFKETGEIALIDFGCVKALSDRFVEKIPALLHSFHSGDLSRIIDAYGDLGMKMNLENEDAEGFDNLLRSFGQWLSKPFENEYFDFRVNWDYTSSGRDLIQGLSHLPGVETLQRDFIFFDRTVYGLFKIFERMEAKVAMRKHWEKLW